MSVLVFLKFKVIFFVLFVFLYRSTVEAKEPWSYLESINHRRISLVEVRAHLCVVYTGIFIGTFYRLEELRVLL